ncbi:MAG: serine protease Do [Anaerophaga sp.]|nr:serine protease Do [Anaerophaga sp.]
MHATICIRQPGLHSILQASFYLVTPSRFETIVAGLIAPADRIQVNVMAHLKESKMIHKSILIILNLILSISVFGQINNPTFTRRDVPYCDITKIEINDANTIVHFKYKAPSTYVKGGWVCAGKDFFIRDISTKKTYTLIEANNIPICPKKHNFQYQGQILEFSLIFQAIPSSAQRIDIIENETSGGFNFYGITLSNSSNQTTETKTLKSAGKFRESDSPLSDVITVIPAGTTVKVISSSGSYYKVEYNGRTGYLSELYFESSSISSNTTAKKTYKPNNSKPTNCDEIKYVAGSSKPSFNNMLAGVKYAVIINRPKINGHVPAFNALFEYLEAMGFQVEYMSENYVQPKHLCDEVWTYISFDYDLQKFSNIKWHFISPCNGYTWDFSSYKIARAGLYDNPKNNFYKVLRDMYQYQKPTYNKYYRIELPKRKTCWSEYKIKQDFQTNGADRIEGIYENSSNTQAKYRVALKKIKEKYYLIYLSGANNSGNWEEGEIKATLIPTATPLFFKAKWIMADKSENDEFYISFEQGMMNVIDHEQEKSLYIKMYPTSTDNISSFANVPASGTGFAITTNGLIVTNHHVVDGAKSIKVRGINNDFSRTYSAKLVISDKNNDLAIIKIDDYSFSSLGTIPYTLKTNVSNVGENIFVLGYPLRATMGDEVKLTNGIISSKTGFQGDVTSYQISAPVQPGNSGGPLFNSKGQLIGIINAKHLGAENASYAVKSSYLTNLIDLLDYPPTLQTVSSVNGKPLTQQVQIIKKYVYIIEVK